MQDTALIVAGIIFLLVAVMHLLRLIFKAEVKINKHILPLWASVPGFFVLVTLSLWMFFAAK